MNEYIIQRETLTAIADEVRTLSGTTDEMSLDNLQSILKTINSLPDEGNKLPTLTNPGTSDDLLLNKQLIDGNGNIVDGTFTIDEELTAQDGLITQIQNAVNSLPEAKEDPILQNKTVIPTANTQIITADSGYDGLNSITVNGDENLIAENIVSGVSIFGVEGNANSGSGEENIADVCNILITEYANKLVSISYVKCENGTCTQTTITPDTPNFTITNVLCYSIVYIQYVPSYMVGESTNLTQINTYSGHFFGELTASPNETATIAIQYYDF